LRDCASIHLGRAASDHGSIVVFPWLGGGNFPEVADKLAFPEVTTAVFSIPIMLSDGDYQKNKFRNLLSVDDSDSEQSSNNRLSIGTGSFLVKSSRYFDGSDVLDHDWSSDNVPNVDSMIDGVFNFTSDVNHQCYCWGFIRGKLRLLLLI
jgi:hypothetical protein